ncbi:MAG: CBS domain-containing protein [Flavobacteriales bacterium]|nr:CBS domain-containing protein [Flavobacteriales bacterium]
MGSGELVGILSITDLARISFVDSYDPSNFTVDTSVYSLFTLEQIMVRNPKCIPESTTIKEAAEIFRDAEFHALPVVDEENKLTGIVTTTDLIQYLLEQY